MTPHSRLYILMSKFKRRITDMGAAFRRKKKKEEDNSHFLLKKKIVWNKIL